MNGTRHGKQFWTDEKENFGFKALQKMGWTPGTGVGKNGKGLTKCISMVVKNDNAGIGGKNTNVRKHRAIVSMYNDILKKANKKKSEKTTTVLSVEGYMAKNALYRRFRIATINEFQLKETTVVLPDGKRKKKKKKAKGFSLEDQERIALAQRDLKNSGRKGLGFGKVLKPVCIPKAQKVSETPSKKSKKKKKKKKRKRAEESSPTSVAETFLDGLLSDLKSKKKKRKKTTTPPTLATSEIQEKSVKKKKKKKRKLKDTDDKPAKRRKIEKSEVAHAEPVDPKKSKKKKKRKVVPTEAASIEPKKLKTKKKKKLKASAAEEKEAKAVESKVTVKKKKNKKKKKKIKS